MTFIDGSMGEGGGQVLRTALSLSAILGKEIDIRNIRANRPKPGLQPQHFVCVNSLMEITGASVEGNVIGSTKLTFAPGKVQGGKYSFDIGTAGSVCLVSQCLLPVLSYADKKSTVTLRGGTDVPFAPSFDYFSKVFLPMAEKMGVNAKALIQKRGFFPVGGGEIQLEVTPAKGGLKAIQAKEKGSLQTLEFYSNAGSLPKEVAARQADAAKNMLKEYKPVTNIFAEETPSPGTSFLIKAGYVNGAIAGFSSLGRRGKKAEEVGVEAASDFTRFNSSACLIDEHLADQLMIYAALAKGESSYKANATSHAQTNADVIRRLTGIETNFEEGSFVIKGINHANPKG